MVVDFGSSLARLVGKPTPTLISVHAPAGTGVVDVTVTSAGGTSPTGPQDRFSYAPAVTSITPAYGPAAGGTVVTITGTDLASATTVVRFGSHLATLVGQRQGGVIVVRSPPGSGVAYIRVVTPAGTSPTGPQDRFSYEPTVTSLSPTFGPASGGTTVAMTGSNLTGATAVDFGAGPAASFQVASDTVIDAVAPAGTGIVDVTVRTPGGPSPVGVQDRYSYQLAAPVVASVSPTSGSSAGGTSVTLTGSTFTEATQVDFGAVPAATFSVVSDTQITAVTPSAPTGTVDVTVTGPGGTSPTGVQDQFTYSSAGVSVTSINPANGPAAGGTVVTVTGTGFTGATGVTFGGRAGFVRRRL